MIKSTYLQSLMCVNGSDAYVQLNNCFSRLWSQFGDLLTLYIVCGGCQPNLRYLVRIHHQTSWNSFICM